MKHKWFVLFILSNTVNTITAQSFADDKADKYRYALELFNEAKYDQVIKSCDDIALRGGDAQTYMLKAKAYRALGDFNNAIKDYSNAISFYFSQYGKRDPSLYYDRGSMYMCQKNFSDALTDFNEARRLFRQTGKENFIYLEDIARVNHYLEDNKHAIDAFNLAIQSGSLNYGTYIDLLSSLLYNNSIPELKSLTDSLLVAEAYDSSHYYYINTLNDIASNSINAATLEKMDKVIANYYTSNQSCFQGQYFDMLFARAYVYTFLGNDSAAYLDYRVIAKNNSKLKAVGLKVSQLKLKLGLDITPPTIVLRKPQTDIDNKAIVNATGRKYKFFGQVSDSSGIEVINVTSNGRELPPVATTEAGGIFEFNIDLNPGSNNIVVSATDKNENVGSKTFIIDFRETIQSNQNDAEGDFIDIPGVDTTINYFALLIAEKDYDDEGFKDLQTPIDDATEMENILVNQYGFKQENVRLLSNAGRQNIMDSLSKMCKMMTDADNLFVFYAGHGQEKKTNGKTTGGYIIPTDAQKGNRGTYISNEDLVDPVLNTQAHHVLFVLDACFAGLMRSTLDEAPQGIKSVYKYKSRKILTSGNKEEVPDGGEFINNVKNFFRNPGTIYFTASELYNYIINHNHTGTTPVYDRISDAGDLDGQFVFFKKN